MRFEFATATRIIFGAGTLREVGPLARELAPRALVITGANPRRAESLLALLSQHGVEGFAFPVTGEPEIATVQRGVALAKRENCGLVISFGGGSALDPGKPMAALPPTPGELLDSLEVIGGAKR